jgi:hypothetical protein
MVTIFLNSRTEVLFSGASQFFKNLRDDAKSLYNSLTFAFFASTLPCGNDSVEREAALRKIIAFLNAEGRGGNAEGRRVFLE